MFRSHMAQRHEDEIVEFQDGGMKIRHAAREKHPPRRQGSPRVWPS
jgi:hypothetical protein